MSVRIKILSDMPKWKEGATEFTVRVSCSENGGSACTIPKSVIEVLGEPEGITFVINSKMDEMNVWRR